MKGYKNYFKTNSNFIPEVPLNWKKLRVKNLVDKNTYYPVGDGDHGSIKPEMYLEEGVPYIRVQNLSWHGDLLLENVVYISDEVQKANSKSILRPGDILIAKTGATIGKLGLIPNELKEANTTSSVGKLTIDLSRFHPKYILYSFQAKHFNDQIWIQASQKSAQPGFNIDDLIEFEIATPELEEQTKIAAFLDYKTNLIDATIEKKKRLIELLKEKRQAVINEAVTKGLNPNAPMKDSGVEWLGEIPEHWKVTRLKQIAEAFGRIGYRGYTTEDIVGEDEGAITISPSNMKGNYMTFESCTYISWDKYEESPEIKIYNDDILMVKTGSTYGKVGIVKDLFKKATINPQLLVLKNVKVNPDYLYNLLRTNYMQYQVETNVIGSTIPTISQTKILNFSLPLPPNHEIEEIMNYIQNQMNIIDKTIKMIETQIKKVQSYRQSIISEAVTGKIDVREWQIDNN